MSTRPPDPSLASLSIQAGSSAAADTTSSADAKSAAFTFPPYASFPPFYTLQPNLTTRARQFELWASLIISYCTNHRIFRLSLSSPPPDLFANRDIQRALKPADIRTVLDHMSKPENGPQIEWISTATRGEASSSCWVYWKTPTEWADAIHGWVEETGQKGAVLTVYELIEGEAVTKQAWRDIPEVLLKKILAVLVKRGKAQIFGQEDNPGVKFF